MGINDNIATIRGDADNLSKAYFVFFLKKYPQHINSFPAYKGKSPDSLGSVASFPSHALKVVSLALEVAENANDAGKLASYAKRLKEMPQHNGLTAAQFKDAYTALGLFAQEKLGGAADKAGWDNATAKIFAALQAAGM